MTTPDEDSPLEPSTEARALRPRRRYLLVGVAIGVAVGGGVGTYLATRSTSTKSAPYADARAIADRLRCATFTEQSTELFVRTQGECTVRGVTIELYTFHDNSARDHWLAGAQAFGGVYAVGDRWSLSADGASPAGMKPVADVLGGEVR